jgi:L-arabinose isomerase
MKRKEVPVSVVFKPTVKSTEEIYAVCSEANAAKNCIGIIAWMHTFSPAKMWIGGLKICKSLCCTCTRSSTAIFRGAD